MNPEITSNALSMQERKGYNEGHLREDSTAEATRTNVCLKPAQVFFYSIQFILKLKLVVFTGSHNLQEKDFFLNSFLKKKVLLKLLLLLICPDILKFVQHNIGTKCS